jgi:hypothetical protein
MSDEELPRLERRRSIFDMAKKAEGICVQLEPDIIIGLKPQLTRAQACEFMEANALLLAAAMISTGIETAKKILESEASCDC